MHDRNENLFGGSDDLMNISRYESMKKKGSALYFDIEEFIDIVDHYFEKNKLTQATEAVKAALSIHPGSTELKLKYAHVMVRNGKPQEAINLLKKVSELENASYEYSAILGLAWLQLGAIELTEKNFNKAIELSSSYEQEELFYNIGEALERAVSYSLALRFYTRAHKAFPNNVDFIFRMAYCFDQTGQFVQSIEHYNKYLDINPFSENAWYNIGIIYNKCEQYANAVEAYDFAEAIDNEHYDAVFNKANSLANNEQHGEAIIAYDKYLEIYPKSFTAKYYVGECYYQMKNYQESENHFKCLIEEFPDFADSYYGLGLVYNEIKNYTEAIKYLTQAIDLEKEHHDAWFALANVYTHMKDWHLAENTYKQAISVNKFDIDAILGLANVYSKTDRVELAVSIILEAIELMAKSPELHFAVAGYYLFSGNKTLGIEWFKKGMQINKDDIDITFQIYPEGEKDEELAELIKEE